MRLIDIEPLIGNGWVLEKHGVANCHLTTMSLADVPTIEPESLRPKGRWVEKDFGETYECSNCGWLTDFRLSCYCPNCGAKMEG